MRARLNYGVIGAVQTQTSSSTGRVYSAPDMAIAKQNNAWPSAYPDFTITPSVSGKSQWSFLGDGNLVLNTAGVWTITMLVTVTANAKIWGSGGGTNTTNSGAGGAGGAATGRINLESGVSYTLFVGNPGASTSNNRAAGGGGAACGILRAGSTPVMIGGGGGGGFASSRPGGGGGGTTGQDGIGGAGGFGGTQTAAGAGGSGSRRTGGSGSGTNGGRGAGGSGVAAAGGTSGIAGQYVGGDGYLDSGDAGGGGGGGGYYGAGGGGGDASGAGGGGGSGYYNTSYVSTGTLYQATASTPGNSSDSLRGTSGNPTVAGAVVLTS